MLLEYKVDIVYAMQIKVTEMIYCFVQYAVTHM